MLRAFTLCAAVTLALWPVLSSAQGYYAPRVQSLDDVVLDAFPIGDVVFVYRRSELPSGDNAVADLSKIIPAHRAEIHGRPGPDVSSLINQMLGTPHTTHVESLSAINYGDSGYVWKVTRKLFPSFGGFSGVPFQFRSYVNPDGSLIAPERYLCDHDTVVGTEGRFFGNDNIFSVMSFADFEVDEKNAKHIHGDQALSLATNAIEKFVAQKPLKKHKVAYRLHDQSLLRLPVATNHDGKLAMRKVWAVNFVDAKLTGNAIHEAEPLTVWVTVDGMVSQLTFRSWKAQDRRVK